MTIRERLRTVYSGGTPDMVPLVLDLQHWYYHKNSIPFDIGNVLLKPDKELIDFHKNNNIGFFMPNFANFMSVSYSGDVIAKTEKTKINGTPVITWSFETPIGKISRARIWEEKSYSWAVKDWGIKTEQDIKILGYVMSRREFICNYDSYNNWSKAVGDYGLVYIFQPGYSGIGNLLNTWMGVEGTVYACVDWEDTVREVVNDINNCNLKYIDLLAKSSSEVILLGDNFSSDVQPKSFFNKWTREYYLEAVKRLHKAGKYVAVHVDGKLRGAIEYISETGADCIDAVTPKPQGDLSPRECREEAGEKLILSGGISPCFLLDYTTVDEYKNAVIDWLELRHQSPALILAVGDEVPLGANEDRLKMLPELIEKYGRN